jgi:carboxymethylenebutenolidase
VLEPLRKLTDPMAMDDTQALLGFLDGGEPVRRAPMGCIGWCLGGRLVVRAGARFPERFAAMASLHPTTMVTGEADSAHRLLSTLRGEIYFGLAELDRHSQPDTIAALRASLESAPVRSHIEVHRGIDHGYALPDRDIFDKQAANRDWERIFAMFRRRLQLA